jgi:hypothetical protein
MIQVLGGTEKSEGGSDRFIPSALGRIAIDRPLYHLVPWQSQKQFPRRTTSSIETLRKPLCQIIMHFSSLSARTACGYILPFTKCCLWQIALSATCTLSIAPIGHTQPSRPPQPGQSQPSGQPEPTATPRNQTPNQVGSWQKFRFPEGRFTVALPQKPIETSEKDSDGDVSYIYKVERDQDFYVISHIDIATLTQVSPNGLRDILQKMPVDMVKSIGGKLVNNKKITLRKNPGQEFDFLMQVSGKETPGKGRIYVVGTRVYTLISVGKPQDTSRFVNSFNLL